MKKKFLTLVALMVASFFVATEFAQAADITFSGQMRTRYEVNEQGSNGNNDFNNISDASDIVQARVRLNANVNINDTTSAFIQMQSARNWGAGTGGSGNASFTASDADASVGLHQAYFTLKNFAALPVDLKLGRQQIVLDGHRLFGHTGWTTGAQTHDALRLTHKHDNMAINYSWIVATEDGTATQGGESTNNEIDVHFLHFNYKGLLGGNFSALYAWVQDPCGGTGSCDNGSATAQTSFENDIHTIGFRQKGQFYGIDYRGEYYYQWGDADQDADALVGGTATGLGVERDAFMFGVRLGKTFKNVTMKPSITLWYDYLSGTEDSDLTKSNPEYKSFNTLFDTGHKFYGFMDLYLGVGSGNQTNGTGGLGLQDIAIKTKLSPAPGWTFKADYHWFSTTESASANVNRAVNTGGGADNALGNELDLTLINKYNANTNIVFGFSNYTTTATFRDLRNVLGDGANWAYVMLDVKF